MNVRSDAFPGIPGVRFTDPAGVKSLSVRPSSPCPLSVVRAEGEAGAES